jgi:hypothetical protein
MWIALRIVSGAGAFLAMGYERVSGVTLTSFWFWLGSLAGTLSFSRLVLIV